MRKIGERVKKWNINTYARKAISTEQGLNPSQKEKMIRNLRITLRSLLKTMEIGATVDLPLAPKLKRNGKLEEDGVLQKLGPQTFTIN